MKRLIIILWVIFFGYSFAIAVGNAEVNAVGNASVEGKTFVFRPELQSGFESKIHNHLSLFKKLQIDSLLFNKKMISNKKGKVNEKIRVDYDPRRKTMKYRNLRQYGISTMSIDDYGMPTLIIFSSSGGRNLTKDENEYYSRTSKLPPSYVAITKEEAAERAKLLLKIIEGETESKKYDSVFVIERNNSYGVHFMVKIRNDICDSRSARFSFDANTGEIESFAGDGKREDVDFSYIPKIPKAQVLQMYADETRRINAEIDINEISLSKRTQNGQRRWVWQIYGTRKDKRLEHAAMMIIDSETGEVLGSAMGY